jgi:hypothetical protein
MQRSDEREAETATGSDKSLTGSDQNLDFDVESDIGSDVETDFGSEVASKTSEDNRRLPTIRSLVFVIVASAIGFLGGGSVPIIGTIGQFLGLFISSFLIGAIGSRGRYAESAIGGGLVTGTLLLLGTLTSVFTPFAVEFLADYGIAIAGAGVGLGSIIAVIGHYFGRDLRSGLTKDI